MTKRHVVAGEKMLWHLFFVFVALFFVFETGWWFWVPRPAEVQPSMTTGFRLLQEQLPGSEPYDKERIVGATNVQRNTKAKLAPLRRSPILDAIAKRRVLDMQQNHYFAHESPTSYGADDMARFFRYRYIRFGENIALGNFGSEAEIVQAWMKSQGHKANILNTKFREIGVASGPEIYQGQSAIVIVQVFGLPVWDCPPVDETLLDDITAEQVHVLQMQAAADEILRLLKATNVQTPEGRAIANTFVTSYNDLAGKIRFRNSVIQDLNNRYNAQVKAFNECV